MLRRCSAGMTSSTVGELPFAAGSDHGLGETKLRPALADADNDGARRLRSEVVDDLTVELRLARRSLFDHGLRVRVENSWGQARWDSVAVHVGGTLLELPEKTLAHLTDLGVTLAEPFLQVLVHANTSPSARARMQAGCTGSVIR